MSEGVWILNIPGLVKIFLAIDPCDMRKSFNGLQTVARFDEQSEDNQPKGEANRLKEDPCSGALFLFSNKRRNRLKVLYWDGTGLWVLGKRLEQGRFSWPRGVNEHNGKPQSSGIGFCYWREWSSRMGIKKLGLSNDFASFFMRIYHDHYVSDIEQLRAEIARLRNELSQSQPQIAQLEIQLDYLKKNCSEREKGRNSIPPNRS